jgi:hypothetical protein
MKLVCSFVVAGLLSVAMLAQASAQEFKFDNPFAPAPARTLFQPASKSLDNEGLRQMLVGLGYSPERIDVGNYVAYRITLTHADGSRITLVAVDNATKMIAIVGGGFASAPDPKVASNDWFQRFVKTSNAISPNYLFMNDQGVFGMATVMGNTDITANDLKAKLEQHVSTFDSRLAPLVKELTQPSPVFLPY